MNGTFSHDGIATTYPWSSTQVNSIVPTDQQCWKGVSKRDVSLSGSYNDTTWFAAGQPFDMCVVGTSFTSSYEYLNPEASGYYAGDCTSPDGILNGAVCQGSWWEVMDAVGIMMSGVYTKNGTEYMRTIWWAGLIDTIKSTTPRNDPDTHGQDNIPASRDIGGNLCNRNVGLERALPGSTTTSGTTSIAVASVSCVVLLLVLLF